MFQLCWSSGFEAPWYMRYYEVEAGIVYAPCPVVNKQWGAETVHRANITIVIGGNNRRLMQWGRYVLTLKIPMTANHLVSISPMMDLLILESTKQMFGIPDCFVKRKCSIVR
jgi:hypothetical protein